ncbi:MAG: alpha/beta fold hydrolase [Chloroflexi bacterium]|nr:alpha/beta fold hydrolase [Chloroflexota bacterium]
MLLILAALLLLAVVAFHALAALYLAESFTRSKRRRVQGTPGDLGLRYEDVQFLTADRLVLRGWFLDSPGARATVIIVHDHEGTRADQEQGLLRLQRDYVRRGFNVFAFDLRGRGESTGRRDGLGQAERLDLQAAAAYVRRRTGSLPIVLHGFGLGAALSIAVAARGIDAVGVIADSSFSSMQEYLRYRSPHVPRYLFRLACIFARRFFHADPTELRPIAVVDRVEVPVLFIHAEGDTVVPVSHTLNLAAASLDPRDRVWTIPDVVDHCRHYVRATETYMGRCISFIDQVVPTRLLEAQPQAV